MRKNIIIGIAALAAGFGIGHATSSTAEAPTPQPDPGPQVVEHHDGHWVIEGLPCAEESDCTATYGVLPDGSKGWTISWSPS